MPGNKNGLPRSAHAFTSPVSESDRQIGQRHNIDFLGFGILVQ